MPHGRKRWDEKITLQLVSEVLRGNEESEACVAMCPWQWEQVGLGQELMDVEFLGVSGLVQIDRACLYEQ